ncbi:MAG: efflux RND transporter periplasmic adaptor subunit [Candidatus Omnitrophica bacterium]|nr:efflux RND transporter periplasmic adaptor subunit [Candidatus Omnitrophota bacterium]MBU4346618.1 efflux RND transporter periplasmic adaptor subunit [Candidatus Omnitrophota bacterium]MBU4473229.1 efflux RND transporter periplasmic adaptor subunit [Candidatus Omnitrophota bacterium]MCG2706544.1 efflux RND transporter periplasmic adaptor subunit [Candidatus Omnitrophota bacterium]
MYKFIVILMLSIALIFGGCQKKDLETKKGPQITPVKAIRVELGGLDETLEYIGNIKAKDEVIVYPKVSGKIIEKVKQDGNPIDKGEVIAYIDRDEVGLRFENAPVESPLAGIVGRLYVDIGSNVTPEIPVALVVNMDIVKVKINIVERDLPRIKLAQAVYVKVDAYPELAFEGKIEKISPVVDLLSRTALVEVAIANSDHRLKPGMFARIKILIRKKENVLVIPRDAIIKEDSSNYVFLVNSDNKAHRQKIEIGLHENNKFEVISGLNQGEIVVTMGNTLLNEGDAVEVIDNFNIEDTEEQIE